MKTKYFILFAFSLFALSCMKETASESSKTGEKVIVRVSMPDEILTRVSLTEASNHQSIALAWEANDKISINGESFTIQDGFTAHEASFEGTAPASSPYTIIYPGKYTSAEAFNARSYVDQTQNGNSSTAHLEYNAMLSDVTAYTEPKFDAAWAADNGGGSLVQNGVIQLRLQLPEGVTTASSVSLVASRAIFPTTNGGADKSNTQSLILQGITLPTNRILEAYMMFSSAGVAIQNGDKLSIIVESSKGLYYKKIDLTEQTWAGGSQYTIQCKLAANTFVINNADDLEEFREGVNSGDMLWQTCDVSLGNNIDCASITNWTPIGNGTFTPVESGSVTAEWTEPAFKGIFDGKGYAIKNLVMTASPATYNPYGLFGILYKATVKDLTLGAASGDNGALNATPQGRMDAGAVAGVAYGATVQNVTNYYPMTIPAANSSANRVAMGMVGYVYGDADSGLSVLSGLTNYGKVSATQSSSNSGNGATSVQVAGIAGFGNSGAATVINQITSCTNYADVETSTGRSAGILGAANTRTAINGCQNRGEILNSYTNARVGGISVIIAGNCTIEDCINFGKVKVTGSGANVGGIVCLINHDEAVIKGSRNEGLIEGVNYVGGISANFPKGLITGCVNLGDISGTANVGGIVGRMGNNEGWPHLEKCRSNAAISATSSASAAVGGIAGLILGGVLNTCFAKGTVTGAGYDIGGIVGQMYCNDATYGRQYVYDCLAAVNVTCTRASGSANVGGVAGRIIRNEKYTGQYMALDNCIGLNQSITSNLQYTGALVGNVDAKSSTNAAYVRVRNCISLVEDSNYHANTSANNTGGFAGAYLGQLTHCYYLVSDNKQTAVSGAPAASNLTKSDLTTLTSAEFCSAHSTRATNYNFTVNGVQYKSSGWEIPSGCSYPVPKTLAALGEAYYK